VLDQLSIAIVCDWLTVNAGAERVILEMHKLFPKAPIYTTLYKAKAFPSFKVADVRESRLRLLPFSRRMHKVLFPFMPRAFEAMDLSAYDLVISSSHSAAKGIITRPETLHVSYCHSPMRYVWDGSHDYQKSYKAFLPFRFLYRPILHRIRMWDSLAAERVDRFLANSDYISRRIKKYYHRESEVIHPPVDLSAFSPADLPRESYLAVGRLTPYKRFDLLVEAFKNSSKQLTIVGVGPQFSKLRRRAGKNIRFLGLWNSCDCLWSGWCT
jgi:glycosyltransferase involved in cell wall biosynthesis